LHSPILQPASANIAIIDNPEELNCGADYNRMGGAMGIGWGSWLLIIDLGSFLINAYPGFSKKI
jgi:hypothetical protein